jgi:hypothetical protein
MHFCTPDDGLVVRNILSFMYKILSQFVKPPSNTLLCNRHLQLHEIPDDGILSESVVERKLWTQGIQF